MTDQSRFAYLGLDRIIHERARLGILTGLLAHPDGLFFGELKRLCGMTDGNLSRHLSMLEEHGMVICEKRIEKNRPQTICRVTDEGRRRFLAYLNELEGVVADAAAAARGEVREGFQPAG